MLALRASRGAFLTPKLLACSTSAKFHSRAEKPKDTPTPRKELGCSYEHYNIIEKCAKLRSEQLSHSLATTLLSQFIESKYNSLKLRQFLTSGDEARSKDITINDYFVILKVCSFIDVGDLDLVASLSENVRLAFVDTYKKREPPIYERNDTIFHADDKSKADKERQDDPSHQSCSSAPPEAPSLMDAVRTTCILYNELKILYDPLFRTIGNILMECNADISCQDAELLMRTFAAQNYRGHPLIGTLVSRLEDGHYNIDRSTAISLYKSLSLMELLGQELSEKLEAHFCSRQDGADGVSFKFSDELDTTELIELGYIKFIQGAADNAVFLFVKSVLEGIANKSDTTSTVADISSQHRRKITLLTAFLKCLSEPCYNTLGDTNLEKIHNIISAESGYKKFRTTKFVEKVSEHLTKLRIRHDTNVYVNGVLLDIIERPRNVVWLCNSYHRFYAASFDPTAESKALERLIRAFGFKTCPINYYQWGRLKVKRTRFAYIRMARYYAINDYR